MNKKLIIFDGNSLLHRAFHALPPLTTKEGCLVNGVYGFFLVFLRVLRELKPHYVAVTFDVSAPTFRQKKYGEYKANRKPAPQELYDQLPILKKAISSFGITIFEKEGFEADDVIGTISLLAPRKQAFPALETVIVTGDQDAFQLVDKSTKVLFLKKGIKDVSLFGEKEVEERYGGLTPEQVADFKSLRGDPSDNIPGITGIGEKTAIELLLKFKTLEGVFQEIGESDVKPRIKQIVLNQKEQAMLSHSLAEIYRGVDIDLDLEKCSLKNYNKENAAKALENLNFSSLVAKLPEALVQESLI